MLSRSRHLGFTVLASLALATLTLYAFYARALPALHAAPARAQPSHDKPVTAVEHDVAIALETRIAIDKPALAEADGVQLQAHVDRSAVLRGADGDLHVEVTLGADEHAKGDHAQKPSDVLVVLDISGSMSGQKLDYAKQALRELVGRLNADDRFGLVSYASEAELELPLQKASASARANFRRVIDALDTRGGTNMSAGLDLGIEQLRQSHAQGRSARVLLLSDGQANEGDATPSGLLRRARGVVKAEHVLSAMGVGDDFNEDLMTSLADAGTGNFYYLSRVETLPRFFDAELRAAKETVARALELRFAPEASIEVVDASGYPIERSGGIVRVRPGNLYAGQKRTLWLTLRAPTDKLGELPLGRVSLAYKRGERALELSAGALPAVACIDDAARFEHAIDKDRWQDFVLNEQLHKTELEIGSAIGKGDARDVDKASAVYKQNRTLAEKLGAERVLSSFDWLDDRSASAKTQQKASPERRSFDAKQAKARAKYKLRSDAYNDDPLAGME